MLPGRHRHAVFEAFGGESQDVLARSGPLEGGDGLGVLKVIREGLDGIGFWYGVRRGRWYRRAVGEASPSQAEGEGGPRHGRGRDVVVVKVRVMVMES